MKLHMPTPTTKRKVKSNPEPEESAIRELAKETGRLASNVAKQNSLSRRLLVGILFGVGTAIGASIIATILVVAFSRIVAAFGVDLLRESEQFQDYLEQNIEQSGPEF